MPIDIPANSSHEHRLKQEPTNRAAGSTPVKPLPASDTPKDAPLRSESLKTTPTQNKSASNISSQDASATKAPTSDGSPAQANRAPQSNTAQPSAPTNQKAIENDDLVGAQKNSTAANTKNKNESKQAAQARSTETPSKTGATEPEQKNQKASPPPPADKLRQPVSAILKTLGQDESIPKATKSSIQKSLQAFIKQTFSLEAANSTKPSGNQPGSASPPLSNQSNPANSTGTPARPSPSKIISPDLQNLVKAAINTSGVLDTEQAGNQKATQWQGLEKKLAQLAKQIANDIYTKPELTTQKQKNAAPPEPTPASRPEQSQVKTPKQTPTAETATTQKASQPAPSTSTPKPESALLNTNTASKVQNTTSSREPLIEGKTSSEKTTNSEQIQPKRTEHEQTHNPIRAVLQNLRHEQAVSPATKSNIEHSLQALVKQIFAPRNNTNTSNNTKSEKTSKNSTTQEQSPSVGAQALKSNRVISNNLQTLVKTAIENSGVFDTQARSDSQKNNQWQGLDRKLSQLAKQLAVEVYSKPSKQINARAPQTKSAIIRPESKAPTLAKLAVSEPSSQVNKRSKSSSSPVSEKTSSPLNETSDTIKHRLANIKAAFKQPGAKEDILKSVGFDGSTNKQKAFKNILQNTQTSPPKAPNTQAPVLNQNQTKSPAQLQNIATRQTAIRPENPAALTPQPAQDTNTTSKSSPQPAPHTPQPTQQTPTTATNPSAKQLFQNLDISKFFLLAGSGKLLDDDFLHKPLGTTSNAEKSTAGPNKAPEAAKSFRAGIYQQIAHSVSQEARRTSKAQQAEPQKNHRDTTDVATNKPTITKQNISDAKLIRDEVYQAKVIQVSPPRPAPSEQRNSNAPDIKHPQNDDPLYRSMLKIAGRSVVVATAFPLEVGTHIPVKIDAQQQLFIPQNPTPVVKTLLNALNSVMPYQQNLAPALEMLNQPRAQQQLLSDKTQALANQLINSLSKSSQFSGSYNQPLGSDSPTSNNTAPEKQAQALSTTIKRAIQQSGVFAEKGQRDLIQGDQSGALKNILQSGVGDSENKRSKNTNLAAAHLNTHQEMKGKTPSSSVNTGNTSSTADKSQNAGANSSANSSTSTGTSTQTNANNTISSAFQASPSALNKNNSSISAKAQSQLSTPLDAQKGNSNTASSNAASSSASRSQYLSPQQILAGLQNNGVLPNNTSASARTESEELLSSDLKIQISKLIAALKQEQKSDGQDKLLAGIQAAQNSSVAANPFSFPQLSAGQAARRDSTYEEAGVGLLLRMLASALNRIQFHQLSSLQRSTANESSETSQSKSLQMEIPILGPHHNIDLFQLRIEEKAYEHTDNSNEDTLEKQWVINLAFDIAPLGQMYVQAKLVKHTLSTHIWADNSEALQMIQREGHTLRERLQEQGLEIREMTYQQGKPQGKETRIEQHLVNTNA